MLEYGKDRPIKVKFISSEAVLHILRKAKTLKESEENKDTYLAPYRSLEEKKVHSGLVGQLKTAMKADPNRYHYIRGRHIVSVDRTATE